MMQGDAYKIPVIIETEAGPAAYDAFADVEILIGSIRKTKSAGEISYSEEQQAFLFPITQQETLLLSAERMVRAQVRVKMPTGEVQGVRLPDINVVESLSEVVL